MSVEMSINLTRESEINLIINSDVICPHAIFEIYTSILFASFSKHVFLLFYANESVLEWQYCSSKSVISQIFAFEK